MENVIIVIHLLVVLALVGVVLLQRSEGGALGMGGGGVSGFMTGRGQANALTRATAILAALFFLTSIILSVLASRGRQSRSIVPGSTPPISAPATPGAPVPGSTPAPAPSPGGVFDQIQRLQQPAAPPPPSAPPAPSAPAPASPAAPPAPTAPRQ
jgi:preprotein translocase subunit SecG